MATYSTATAVGSLLSTTFSGTTDPTATEVNDVLSRVSDLIDRVTGRIWTTATTTEYHDARSSRGLSETRFPSSAIQSMFFLKRYPIVSVQSIQENTSGLSGEAWTSRSTGYGGDAIFYAEEGAVKFIRNSPSGGLRNVKITYTYGVGATPNDIKYAAELLAGVEVINMIKRVADQEGLRSVSVGNATYNFGDLDRLEKSYQERADRILRSYGYWIKAGGGV